MNGVGVFQVIFQSSIIGSLLIGVVFLIRIIIKKKVNPAVIYYMWILVIVKLIVPYGPESRFSIYNAFNFERAYIYENINSNKEIKNVKENAVIESTDTGMDIKVSDVEEVSEDINKNKSLGIYNNQGLKENGINIDSNLKEEKGFLVGKANIWFKEILFIIWLIGIVGFSTYITIGYINLKKIVKKRLDYDYENLDNILSKCLNIMKIKKKVEIIVTDKINTPSLCGIINPKILIPENILIKSSEEEMKYIILHELCHFKRKDIPLSWVICFLKVIYWFNPIVILGLNTMNEDCETSCDSMVLSYLENDENIYYGNTIINVASIMNRSRYFPGTTSIILSKKKLKERVEMISKNEKFNFKNLIIGIIIIFIIGAIGLTSANRLGSGKSDDIKVVEEIERGFEDIVNIEFLEGNYENEEYKINKSSITDETIKIKRVVDSVHEKLVVNAHISYVHYNNKIVINKKDGSKEAYYIWVLETSVNLQSTDSFENYSIQDPDAVIDFIKVYNEVTGISEGDTILPYEVFRKYIDEKGYKLLDNNNENTHEIEDRGQGFKVKLPDSFDAIITRPKEEKYEFEVGELFSDRNESSKKEGLDFSEYLGKEVMCFTFKLESEGDINKDIIVLIYENKVIGSWISPEYSNEMERDHVWISMSGQN